MIRNYRQKFSNKIILAFKKTAQRTPDGLRIRRAVVNQRPGIHDPISVAQLPRTVNSFRESANSMKRHQNRGAASTYMRADRGRNIHRRRSIFASRITSPPVAIEAAEWHAFFPALLAKSLEKKRDHCEP